MANNPKYRQIKAFCLAVQTGSFTAAAQAMHITQPSFTALIKALERDVGQRLFDRTTRRCEPSAGGLAFYQRVAQPLQDLEEAYQQARDEGAGERGRLTIATVPSLSAGLLARALGRFHQSYPQVQLFMSEQRSDEVPDFVLNNRAELGIGRMPCPMEGLAFIPLFTDTLMLAAPQGHVLLAAERLGWADFRNHRVILVGGGVSEQYLRATLPNAVYLLEVTHVMTALSLVREGVGIAFVPTTAIPTLDATGLVFKSIDESTATRHIGAIHKRHRALSTPAQRFVDLVRTQAAETLPG